VTSESNYKKIIESDLPHQLADEHWGWISTMLEKVYKDAFLHGYKHGVESLPESEARG